MNRRKQVTTMLTGTAKIVKAIRLPVVSTSAGWMSRQNLETPVSQERENS